MPVLSDVNTVGAFRSLHQAVGRGADRLERDSLLLEAVSGLISRNAQNRPARHDA